MALTPYQSDMSIYRCVTACPACKDQEVWVEPVQADYDDPLYWWPQRFDAWDCLSGSMGVPGCQCPPPPFPIPQPPPPPDPPDPDDEGGNAQ